MIDRFVNGEDAVLEIADRVAELEDILVIVEALNADIDNLRDKTSQLHNMLHLSYTTQLQHITATKKMAPAILQRLSINTKRLKNILRYWKKIKNIKIWFSNSRLSASINNNASNDFQKIKKDEQEIHVSFFFSIKFNFVL